jgi:hypothetical protein
MKKIPSKSLDVSQDLSGDFSHTNDCFDGTKSHQLDKSSTHTDIKNPATPPNKVPGQIKTYLGNRRLLKAMNQQDSS